LGFIRAEVAQRFAGHDPSLCPRCGAFFKQAVAAGAKVTMPLNDMFWGDRYGKLEDPFGHHWSVTTHVRDVKPEELKKAAQKACG
jgi:PhnB protein